jgi:hypothetical protein
LPITTVRFVLRHRGVAVGTVIGVVAAVGGFAVLVADGAVVAGELLAVVELATVVVVESVDGEAEDEPPWHAATATAPSATITTVLSGRRLSVAEV